MKVRMYQTTYTKNGEFIPSISYAYALICRSKDVNYLIEGLKSYIDKKGVGIENKMFALELFKQIEHPEEVIEETKEIGDETTE